MKWIFLIGNETFNVETVKKLKHADMVRSYDEDGRYCVDFGDDHIFYEQMTNIDEFEGDMPMLPFINPTIIMMTYTSSERVRKVLSRDNFPKDIYIDNDFGLIVSLAEFINLGMPME